MGGLKGQGAFQVPEYFIMKVRKKYYYLSVVKLFFFFKLERKILWVLHLLHIDQLQMRMFMAKMFLEQRPTHRPCPET